MSSFREQLRNLQRQFNKEVSLLRAQQELTDQKVDQRFQGIELILGDMRLETKALVSTAETLSTDVKNTQATLGAMKSSVETMQSTVETMHSNVGTLQSNVESLQSNFSTMATTVERVTLRMVAQDDRMGALVGAFGELRNEFTDQSRTVVGRTRLLEERVGTFIQLIDNQHGDLEERVAALERKINPAA